VKVYAYDCNGVLTSEILCSSLEHGQFWDPEVTNDPSLSQKKAIEVASKAIENSCISGDDFDFRYIKLTSCGEVYIYVVVFSTYHLCEDSTTPLMKSVSVAVLMDEKVIIPVERDSKGAS
jgi:hypothetical protein